MCRLEEIHVHSQLYHPNIIYLEAVLTGEKHERHEGKRYVYCFMTKMDVSLRKVLSASYGEYGSLKQLLGTEEWDVVLLNIKHILRSVLKALCYMHSQGFNHNNIQCM